MTDLLEHVDDLIRRERLLPRRSDLVVAVSGGLDSMVLLAILVRLSERWSWKIHVAHFNHRLRGRDSANDERFVRSAARSLGCDFHANRWSKTGQGSAIKAHGLEMAAREARRAFFKKVLRKTGGTRLVMAHHADDQAELFFIRLFRGTGTAGLGGMRLKSRFSGFGNVNIVRPLLRCTRDELLAWAKENRIRFREDTSNADERILRNRIRHQLLPELETAYSTSLRSKLQETMQIIADEADFTRDVARRYLQKPDCVFSELPIAIQRLVILLQLEQISLDNAFESIESLRASSAAIVNLSGAGSYARDAFGRLMEATTKAPEFRVGSRCVELAGQSGRSKFGQGTLSWKRLEAVPRDIRRGTVDAEYFDANKVGARVVLRYWQPGDRFQPIGLPRAAKLQDLFTNAKIPAKERRELVVAETAKGQIFWVEGLRIGEIAKVSDSTTLLIRWAWQRK